MEVLDYTEKVDSRLTDLFRKDSVYLAIVHSLADLFHMKQLELAELEDVMLNIDKSTGANLDIIGNIVGQPRKLISIDENPYFGFDGATNAQTFGSASNPAVGGEFRSVLSNPSSQTIRSVDDATYRKLIKARILKNKSNGTINDLLSVINILAGNTLTRVDIESAGNAIIVLKSPVDPLLNYFINRRNNNDTLIPIPLGVRTKVIEV